MLIPYNIAKLAFHFLSTKISFALTSIPGPKNGYWFANVKMKAMGALMPTGAGENHMGIAAISCDKIITLTLLCDENQLE